MHCYRKVTGDLFWVGGDDRRLAMFEGVYSVPKGVSYNSYLLLDDMTVLFDTVDKAVGKVFFENVQEVLGQRPLNYVVIHHMEPDHSATLTDLLERYPEAVVVCNERTLKLLVQFMEIQPKTYVVDQSSEFCTGHHELHFVMAPMVHWPEVMMTYDVVDRVLFSADAFGTFGAHNGALFSDEVNFQEDYLDEARRYYCNIVGKYGRQVQAVLEKMNSLEVDFLCPLHGFVWRKGLDDYVNKYQLWSQYIPEENGVVIAYASIYGNTENAVEILASRLVEKGVTVALFDVSVTPSSEVIAAAFRYSHLIFASPTYNSGIFVTMDQLLRDLVAHNIQNRVVGLIENGSWAPQSQRLMKALLDNCSGLTYLSPDITIHSSLKRQGASELDVLAQTIVDTLVKKTPVESPVQNLSYGLYVLTTKEGDKDNGCIINAAMQLTVKPERIAVAVNKGNFTHDQMLHTGNFNLSILERDAPFSLITRFGFASGREQDKFSHDNDIKRLRNGVSYIEHNTNGVIGAKVVQTMELGTHTLFVGEIEETKILSEQPSLTYERYLSHIKPVPQKPQGDGKVWVCKICGYIYDDSKEKVPFEELPEDWLCPLCKHPKSDFELM